MGWSTRGVIVPAPLPLQWSRSHAALPVAVATADGLRLYCSSRDDRGRSQIASGGLDIAGGAATFDAEPAVTLGPLGAFDDNGVTSSCVVLSDGRLFQYYTGWTLGGTVPFHLAIGCATSDDGGRTFAKVSPAPVLGRNRVDPFLTASPAVLIENGLWRMWYVSASEWQLEGDAPRHRYHIKYAESDDGLEWRPTGRVCIDYKDDRETSIARPCVLKRDGTYTMWYCSRGDAYRIGYAESRDGLDWTRLDDEAGIAPQRDAWDAEMQAYPYVFDYGGGLHMLYNGNGYGATGIGYAISSEAAERAA